MPLDTPISELVTQLRRTGLRPPERLAERIVAQGAAARGTLLELALERDTLLADAPECWGPIHALRLLGELHDPTLIDPLLAQFPIEIEYDEQPAPLMWGYDVTQLLGRMGAAAAAPLWAWLDDEAHHEAGRAAAAEALAYATRADPDLRPAVVAGMRQRLAETSDPLLAGFAAGCLARLAATEAYNEVLAGYRAKRISTKVIAASDARQMLLGKPMENLACVNHSLWERYDQHGPFPPKED